MAEDEKDGGSASNGASGAKDPRKSILKRTINRRNSREWALQMLFWLDSMPLETTFEDFFVAFWGLQASLLEENGDYGRDALEEYNKPANNMYRAFAEKLVRGTWEKRDEIDARISRYLINWTLSRMGAVDRNALRLAFFELFFDDGTPPIVVVNEAVDVVKYFSMRDSGKFVNGVLDRAIKDVDRPLRECRFTPRRNKRKKGGDGARKEDGV